MDGIPTEARWIAYWRPARSKAQFQPLDRDSYFTGNRDTALENAKAQLAENPGGLIDGEELLLVSIEPNGEPGDSAQLYRLANRWESA